MEIAKPISDGLRHFQDRGPLPDGVFQNLVEGVFQAAAGCEETEQKEDFSAEAKEAHAALLTAVLEAFKHNASAEEFRSVLEDVDVPESRIVHLCRLLEQNRAAARAHFGQLGDLGFPELMGVEWRLDYQLKSELVEQARAPMYFVTLKYQVGGGVAHKEQQLTCSHAELQDLLAKIKDALKQAEKLHSIQQ